MTAPARPSIPTPADLVRRTTPAAVPPAMAGAPAAPKPGPLPSIVDLASPGLLNPREVLRQMFQQGIRISRMQPEARLVGLTLLTYANFRTGLLNKHAPTPEQLAYATGLTEGQVLVQIQVLKQRGWLTERVLTVGPREGQAVFQLGIPGAVLHQLRNRRATPPSAD